MSKLSTVQDGKKGEKHYTIIVQGHLDDRWARWFSGMEILHLPEGLTRLAGTVVDQAALHGMLSRIGDLRLPLLLVIRGSFELD